MLYEYKVVFEHHEKKFNLVGITKSKEIMNNMAKFVSSKGINHTAIIIDYKIPYDIDEMAYIVYKTHKNMVKDGITSIIKFDDIVIGNVIPSEEDIYLYKTKRSATKKCNDINKIIFNDIVAVNRIIRLDTIYPLYPQVNLTLDENFNIVDIETK